MRKLFTRAAALAATLVLALAAFASPAAASPQLFCSYTVSGGSTTSVNLPTDCGGGSLLSGGYHSVAVLFNGACDSVVANTSLTLTFNSDVGSNYGWRAIYATKFQNNAVITGGTSGVANAMNIADLTCNVSGQYTHGSTAAEIIAPMADQSIFDHSVISTIALNSINTVAEAYAGTWHPSTPAAVTSLQFSTASGADFVAGTRFDVFVE